MMSLLIWHLSFGAGIVEHVCRACAGIGQEIRSIKPKI
jgi:hypothetical protein